MTRSAASLLALAAACAAAPPYVPSRETLLRERIEASVPYAKLNLFPRFLGRDEHGGVIEGLAPYGWWHEWEKEPAVFIDTGRSQSVYAVTYRPLVGEEPAAFVEAHELAPVRAAAVVEREEPAEHSRVLVARHGGELRLLMVRWHPGNAHYLRCEARLRGELERAVDAFVTLCAEITVPGWAAR